MNEFRDGDSTDSSCTAVIPARGGSKGIPRKNLQQIGGLSLLARAIQSCQAAELVDQIIVSSEDPEILQEARIFGATPLKRPASLSGDTASSESALLHALDSLDTEPGILLLVQCTSPFINPAHIDGVISRVLKGADTSFTAEPFHSFIWREGSNGPQGVNHDHRERTRRQDRPAEYIETGAVYAMRTDGFRKHGHRFFGKSEIHSVTDPLSLEIDDWNDLEAARLLSPMLGDRYGPAHKVEVVVFDFDGVFTDDSVYVDQDGRETVRCSRGDGLGIERLKKHGIRALVLSKEKNRVVKARCDKLGIDSIQGSDDKKSILQQWLLDHHIDPTDVAYVGNDLNDLECFALVGMSIAVANASPQVKNAAKWILSSHGGNGAVRDVCEWAISNLERTV